MNILKPPTFIEYSLVWWSIILLSYIYRNNILLECVLFLIGLFLYTIMEYTIHRYIFHGPLWSLHKLHHKIIHNENYLIIPFIYSIPIGLMYSLFYILILGKYYSIGLIRGHILGYIGFEYIHYIKHTKNEITEKLRENNYIKNLIEKHKKHNIEYGKRYVNYGCITLYWDKICETIN